MAESVTLPLDNACLISCNECHRAILVSRTEAEETSTCSCGSNNLKKIYYDKETLKAQKEARDEELRIANEKDAKRKANKKAKEEAKKDEVEQLVANGAKIDGKDWQLVHAGEYIEDLEIVLRPVDDTNKTYFQRVPVMWKEVN